MISREPDEGFLDGFVGVGFSFVEGSDTVGNGGEGWGGGVAEVVLRGETLAQCHLHWRLDRRCRTSERGLSAPACRKD
jgi:hypothetical protein